MRLFERAGGFLGHIGRSRGFRQRKQRVLVAMPSLGSNNVSITRLFWELGNLSHDPEHPFSYDTLIAEDMRPHDRARNFLVRMFETTEAEWFWGIDADMKIPPNWQLLFTHPEKKAVSALAFGWQSSAETIPGAAEIRSPKPVPVVFRKTKVWDPTVASSLNYEGEDLQAEPFEADAVGAACLLLRRDLIRAVGFPWFKFSYNEDGSIKEGEDVHFFRKMNAMGERVLIDTRVLVGHWKDCDTMDIAMYGIRVRRGALAEVNPATRQTPLAAQG